MNPYHSRGHRKTDALAITSMFSLDISPLVGIIHQDVDDVCVSRRKVDKHLVDC